MTILKRFRNINLNINPVGFFSFLSFMHTVNFNFTIIVFTVADIYYFMQTNSLGNVRE